MATTAEIHVGDVGTVFEMTVYDDGNTIVDLSANISIELHFLKPGSTTKIEKTATLSTDGTDGKIKYTTITDDLDTAGTWKIQGKVETAAGIWHTDISTFVVVKNL